LTLAVANDILNTKRLDGFRISDLTIDCNMREHNRKGVAIGGVSAAGRRIRISGIRVVDAGTQNVAECFPITAASAHWAFCPDASDCVVEDCIIEQLSFNGDYTTTCILMNATEDGLHRLAFH